MKKEKKQLLWAIIFMVAYIIFNVFYLQYNGGIISKDKSENISNIIVFGLSIIGIIYYLILLIKKDIDLNKHSKGILIWAIIFFIFNIVSGIFGFIIYSNLDSKKKEKRQLPNIELKEYTNKWICLAALIFCLILMFFVSNYLNGIGIIIEYIVIFTTMVIIFRKQLLHDFKIFKEYFREYNSLVVKNWFKALVTISIIGIVIQLITNIDTATNQENLNKMFSDLPILVAILSMIYAPIVEELMFRGVFRKFLNKKYVFILVSGILFGVLHVIDDFQSIGELLYIFVYSTLGIYLASTYYKTNNLCTNIYFHSLQNTLSVVGMLILKFLA